MSEYYIPEIEEIRVGLKCVYSTLNNAFSPSCFLKPENHYEDDLINCLESGLEGGEIKVLLNLFGTMEDVCEQIRVKKVNKEIMSETVKILGQEWCSTENIDLKHTGYITKFEPNSQKWMVLCNKKRYENTHTPSGLRHIGGIRYIPLRFEDLNIAEI